MFFNEKSRYKKVVNMFEVTKLEKIMYYFGSIYFLVVRICFLYKILCAIYPEWLYYEKTVKL